MPLKFSLSRSASALEHFRAKWTPVRVKKMRPNKDLERFRDSFKFGNALALATALGLAAANGPSQAAQWSTTEIQFQYGVFDVPTFVAPAGAKQKTFNLLHQHTSGWSWGDVYYFVEFVSARSNRQIPFAIEDVYGEVYLNFSSAKLLGTKYGGPLRDIGLIQGFNFGVDPKVYKYLPGIRLSWNIPGFAFFNTDFTAYIDYNAGLSSGGAPSQGDSWMVDINWASPFTIHGQKFSIEGHVERIAGRKDELGFTVDDSILGQPQFRWDLGNAFGSKADVLFIGIEWQFWINKLGDSATNENVIQALGIWRF